MRCEINKRCFHEYDILPMRGLIKDEHPILRSPSSIHLCFDSVEAFNSPGNGEWKGMEAIEMNPMRFVWKIYG